MNCQKHLSIRIFAKCTLVFYKCTCCKRVCDKSEHLDILSNENIFVRRLSFMTNRNSIGFLSCSASVEHDKFLIDKILRFMRLKTFFKQFEGASAPSTLVLPVICLIINIRGQGQGLGSSNFPLIALVYCRF